MRILAVGAHLDDIELACGGTLAKAVQNKHIVKMLILSRSGYLSLHEKHQRFENEALKEGKTAASLLGVSDIEILSYQTKDIPYHSAVVSDIEKRILSFAPDLLFTHHVFDTHQAHEGVAKSSISAARRLNTVYMFEPIAPSGRSYNAFRPQLYINISETISDKIEAVKAHLSEYKKYGSEWIDGLTARARYRGYEMGVKYAEAFEVVRSELKLEHE